MKNLAVAKKIMMGFMASIALIALMLGMTIFTSFTRNNDLETIKIITDMQTEASYMLNDVNQGRMEIRMLFRTLGADDEYALGMEYLLNAQARMDELDSYTAQLEAAGSSIAGELNEANAQLHTLYAEVISDIDTVYALDVETRAVIEELEAAASEMATSTSEMFDLAYGVSLDRTTSDPESLITYLPSLLLPTHQLSELVDSVRIMSDSLTLSMDTSVIPDMLASLDTVRENAEGIKIIATTEAGQVASQRVLDSETTYRAAILLVQEKLAQSDASVASARASFDELTGVVNNGVNAIAAETNSMLDTTTATSVSTMIIMIVIGIVSIIFSVIASMVISRMITKPLGIMKDYLVRVGTTGDIDFTSEERDVVIKEAAFKDEVGQSMAAFAGMMDRLVFIGQQLTLVADGDLTSDIDLLTERDTMGKALKAMTNNLNDMFSEINSVAQQVSTASSEIATGAQSLAQGSTEQASTVEEISASINEITQQANISVETANNTAQASQSIRDIAQEGNEKMAHLSGAVQEMSEASQSIGNVIKVIDDIAFQTNILALNAAVEAARAGEHGKGFAVVADEVRNLAGKSAEAAKETAGLISANIEKSEVGLTISQETAETLNRIVEGVEQTTESLHTIAQQSEGSKVATEQVNLAVDQVAQVVQQNSATSEESAAASEEMSSQAQVLQQLIARFKLRESGFGQNSPRMITAQSTTDLPDVYSKPDNDDVIF